jgi:quercetin dioxygenase-like cupin family protein
VDLATQRLVVTPAARYLIRMTACEWMEQLRREGFGHTYVVQDARDARYPDHTHPTATAHVILEGEMTITSQGQTQIFRPGGRFDVPANTVHSARVGPEGCRYIVGEP